MKKLLLIPFLMISWLCADMWETSWHQGNALYHNERNKHKMIFKEKIFNNAVYYKFCRVANYSFSKMFKESYSKLFFILSLPIGI